MVARRLPRIKNYKHTIASFIETKKDLKAFVGLVFSPTTFGRSDELFLHLLVPISQVLRHLSMLLGPYTLCL